jgi:putative NADPH-quinone reductase
MNLVPCFQAILQLISNCNLVVNVYHSGEPATMSQYSDEVLSTFVYDIGDHLNDVLQKTSTTSEYDDIYIPFL